MASFWYEGVTCDDEGTPRGRAIHRIVCNSEGEHLKDTCRLVRGMTISIEEAGAAYTQGLSWCKVCHPRMDAWRRGAREKVEWIAGEAVSHIRSLEAECDALRAEVARLTAALAEAEGRSMSTVQVLHSKWVRRNFSHMTTNELMLAHAAGVSEEYFELGQAIGPLVRAAIKCVNQIKPETWSIEAVGDALADMIIFACQLAESFGIDLGEVVVATAASVRERDWVAHRNFLAAHAARKGKEAGDG